MPTADDVIGAYLKLRTAKEKLVEKQKQELREITDKMDALEVWLQGQLHKLGAQNLRTPNGTAFRVMHLSAKVSDWEALRTHVLEHDAWHLLERRVNKSALQEELDDGRSLPPGVDISRIETVTVRKT
jgi:hypothetical protein